MVLHIPICDQLSGTAASARLPDFQSNRRTATIRAIRQTSENDGAWKADLGSRLALASERGQERHQIGFVPCGQPKLKAIVVEIHDLQSVAAEPL